MSARRLLATEVIQTSAMDCGPAALKCLLEGFGVPASYGRLREACQTSVDGTNIDTLEDVAVRLGLDAEQKMLPADYLFEPAAAVLPALVVVKLPNGFTHFVVAWRCWGDLVQVMDPATGRRWVSAARLRDEIYVHAMAVPAAAFREWAVSDEARRVVVARLDRLGAGAAGEAAMASALADPGWRPIAALEAAARFCEELVGAGAIRRGSEAARLLPSLVDKARRPGDGSIPSSYWTVQEAPPDADGQEQVTLRGAVLLRVRGLRKEQASGAEPLPPDLAAALTEPPSRPARELFRLLRADGLNAPAMLLGAVALAACGRAIEALLLRGALDVGRYLGLPEQRLAGIALLALFLLGLLALEVPIARGVLALGRHLEARLRAAFLAKIPRLGDRYFSSRPTSDMAERSHSIHQIRTLPDLGAGFARAAMELFATVAGIAWIEPRAAPLAALAAAGAIGTPFLFQRAIAERDLRVRVHVGALARFYLDALLGLVAVRAHGADRPVRREHESLLVEWVRAGQSLVRTVVASEAAAAVTGLGLAAWLLLDHLARSGMSGSTLLLAYWALLIPTSGQELALALRRYPSQRNLALRLLEPLGALEDDDQTSSASGATAAERSGAAAIAFEGVEVLAGGHVILSGIDLAIPAGAHVAVVGPSGAGKSSLVGLLLGWHRAARGKVLVDGRDLDGPALETLRADTAWVEPAVQLWNRSLLENTEYGAPPERPPPGEVIEAAELLRVLQGLPEGLQTQLGEGGGLLSGGEGQRVRLARGLNRKRARLVILDEPFRGLDRSRRAALLARAREWWRDSTLICITHDVGQTRDFGRVLVIEGGRVVEDGAPGELSERPGSRYGALLEAEKDVRAGLWEGPGWRRARLEGGRTVDG